MSHRSRMTSALLAVALLGGLLAGCGGEKHDAADVTFVTGMIPHHEQAVAMARMTDGRPGLDPRLVRLAARIRAGQAPEIVTMTGWLADWDEPAPGSSGGTMPGMMSDGDMSRLDASRGVRFERLWLRLMVEHHTGAVDMAAMEREAGRSPDAIALARSIRDSQTAEIAQMRRILASL